MNLRNKLLSTLLLPLLIVGLLGLGALLFSYHNFESAVKRDNTKIFSSLEMEVASKEALMGLFQYVAKQKDENARRFTQSLVDLKGAVQTYGSLKLTQSEQEYYQQISVYINQFENDGNQLLETEQLQLQHLKRLNDLLNNKIERIIEDSWQKYLTKSTPDYNIKLSAILGIEINIHELVSANRGYILNNDASLLTRIADSQNSLRNRLEQIESVSLSKQEKLWLKQINSYYQESESVVQKILMSEKQKMKLESKLLSLLKNLDALLNDKVQVVAKEDLNSTQTTLAILNYIIVAIIIIILIISLLVAWWFTAKFILKPISTLKNVAESVAKGDIDKTINIHSKDELGELANSFRSLVNNTQELVKASQALGKGKFDTNINPRSDADVLGHSLLEMKNNLQQLDSENKKQVWIKTQVSNVTQSIQGIRSLQKLINTVVTELANILKVGYGAFYIIEPNPDPKAEKMLILQASYAYLERKNLSNRFKIGEGIVGQCALEQHPITITEIPDDYIKISSGLGESTPKCIIAIPVLFENRLLGVFEFATFAELTEQQKTVLNDVAKNLGIIINNVESHNKTEDLLKESQNLTEELQTQQEELRAANEELEEKTKILQESEEELKTQSEELQAANEELEEKSEFLEKQKHDIELQNKSIAQAKRQIEDKAKDLELASKYKSEFLANMSHELRTPLNSLLILSKGFVDNEVGNLTPEQIEEAKVIHDGGQDLLTLINDILDLSKVEAGKLTVDKQNVEISSIVNDIQRQFSHVAKDKGLEFKINVAQDVPTSIYTDSLRLEQIIKNLLSNAFKFTSSGEISVNVYKPGSDTHLRNDKLNINNMLAFTVKDSGIGIPPEKQQAIFEAFQQADGSTSRTYGGTGLGLTISREMSKLLGGEVHVRSKENEGSEFIIYITYVNDDGATPTSAPQPAAKPVQQPVMPAADPVTTDPVETKSTEDDVTEEQSAPVKSSFNTEFIPDDRDLIRENSKSLLIIEDDLGFAKSLMKLAQKKGFQVIIAGTGKAGLTLTEQYQPHAIILDMGLPDMSGAQVLERLKFNLETRHIPVHIISGMENNQDTLQKGAVGYLMKPVTSDDLESVFSKIEGMLDGMQKKVLVVEDDEVSRAAIVKLISNQDITAISANNGLSAETLIEKEDLDCIILDLNLPDISGFELLRKLSEAYENLPPIIIYTGRDLTKEEHEELSQYTQTIVVKGVNSPERLLDEVSLFLHSVEENLLEHQKSIIQMLHDPEQALKGRKILLVDDDMRNIFAMSKVLEKQGMDVVMASNGQVAIDKLHSEEGIELIVMDIMMPVMDGFEAISKIRKESQFKEIPIIALTAKAMSGDREKCLSSGANDYMTKPVDVDKLLSMLKVWLFK